MVPNEFPLVNSTSSLEPSPYWGEGYGVSVQRGRFQILSSYKFNQLVVSVVYKLEQLTNLKLQRYSE